MAATWPSNDNQLSALLQGNIVVSALMGLFNSFVSREQSPKHHPLDPTALREALACLPGSKFQLGEFLRSATVKSELHQARQARCVKVMYRWSGKSVAALQA